MTLDLGSGLRVMAPQALIVLGAAGGAIPWTDPLPFCAHSQCPGLGCLEKGVETIRPCSTHLACWLSEGDWVRFWRR